MYVYFYVYDYRMYLYNIECVFVVCLRGERECISKNVYLSRRVYGELVGCEKYRPI